MPKQKPKIKLNDEKELGVGFFWLRNRYLKYLVFSLVVGTAAVSIAFYGGEETSSPDFQIQTVPIEEKYPRLANLFFKWDISDAEARELAKWDVVVIDMEAQVNTPDGLKKLKAYNPQIKILAYITSQEFTYHVADLKSSSLRRRLWSGFSDDWWLKSAGGGRLVSWPGTWLINVTDEAPVKNGKRWNDYLPEFAAKEILSSGLWDGVFYDNAWDSISWLPSANEVDLGGDGKPDGSVFLDQKWKEGMGKIFSRTKELAPGKIIVGNGVGGGNGRAYFANLNGVAIEHFQRGDWAELMDNYFFIATNSRQPAVSIINSNTENTGARDDYEKMRFGLASALLGDGYFSFDYGDQAHNQLWWYDEYSVFLGKPLNSAYNVKDAAGALAAGLWRRDFQNGIVLVNSGDSVQTIGLDEEFEKFHGQQDGATNDGSIIQSATLPARDGLVLLRREKISAVSRFQNGSFTRIFDESGKTERTGLFTYEEKYEPSAAILTVDLDNDGRLETVVGAKNRIEIWNQDGRKIVSFFPYGENYNKGVNFDAGDLNADGKMEIVTGAGRGGGPHVRIFSASGKLLHPGFFAYGKNFRGGVNVALGDSDNDGRLEIITGAGYGGGPQVRIFDSQGKLLHPGFFAFASNFRDGVDVASADLNDDGKDEIIVGAGLGRRPEVRVWSREEKIFKLKSEFFAFGAGSKSGVEVAAEDLDKDGRAEILASTTDVF